MTVVLSGDFLQRPDVDRALNLFSSMLAETVAHEYGSDFSKRYIDDTALDVKEFLYESLLGLKLDSIEERMAEAMVDERLERHRADALGLL